LGLTTAEQLDYKRKWKKEGICRVSASKKVVLLAIYALDSTKWLIVDASDLLALLAGRELEVSIYGHS
jgi:hypothetical protein